MLYGWNTKCNISRGTVFGTTLLVLLRTMTYTAAWTLNDGNEVSKI